MTVTPATAANPAPGARDPRDLLTPQMRGVLDRIARAGHPPIYTLDAAGARAAYEAGSGVLEVPAPRLARVEDFTIPARDGARLQARLYAPVPAGAGALPVLLYFHGGGFTIGSIASHDVLCRTLSHLAGCAVVSLGYRMAPEHRFPVAMNDAWDALRWLQANAAPKGLDGAMLAVGGDSAGGTLAAACALMARDEGLPLCLQLLFYPGTAESMSSASYRRFARGFLLDTEMVEWFFNKYIAPADRGDWRFAPLNADDVEGVPPAWIGLAECDPLVDEGLAYADKLRAAGVAVDLEIYRGVTHEFIKMGRAIPEALIAHADAARALRQAFNPEERP